MTTREQQITSDLPWEAVQLADKLTEGAPEFGFRGDTRLSLCIGVVAAGQAGVYSGSYKGKGTVLARSWQVWRHNEDGTDKLLLQRPLDQLHEILPTLVKMDPRTPGHRDTVELAIEGNERVHREREYAIGQAVGEMTEHLWKLTADSQNGRTTFRGMPGSNPDKQM